MTASIITANVRTRAERTLTAHPQLFNTLMFITPILVVGTLILLGVFVHIDVHQTAKVYTQTIVFPLTLPGAALLLIAVPAGSAFIFARFAKEYGVKGDDYGRLGVACCYIPVMVGLVAVMGLSQVQHDGPWFAKNYNVTSNIGKIDEETFPGNVFYTTATGEQLLFNYDVRGGTNGEGGFLANLFRNQTVIITNVPLHNR